MRMSRVGLVWPAFAVVDGGALFGQGGAAGTPSGEGGGGAKRSMASGDLMAMKRVSDPQISPSGKWVMFSVTEVSLERWTHTGKYAAAGAAR